VEDFSVNCEITKITDGRRSIALKVEPRPVGGDQVVNRDAVEDGDLGLHFHPPGSGAAKEGGFAHLDGRGPQYYHENSRENK
jgi:hypothetical protein